MGLRREDGLLGPVGFAFLMFSMAACLPLFFLGPMAFDWGLSLGQALAGALAGNAVVAAALAVNGLPGVWERIGFGEQAKRVFGRLYKVPVFLRGAIGGLWYGVEAFNGALAMVLIVLYAAGERDGLMDKAMLALPAAIAVYVASIILVYRRGIGAVGRAATIAGPLLLAYFAWLALEGPGVKGLSAAASASAGVPWLSTAFLGYLAVQTNWWATVAVNASDLTRAARDWRSVWIGAALGLVGGQLLGTYLGYVLAASSGSALPHEIILSEAPGAAAVMLGLAFAFLAPWTTDLSANVPALSDLVEELAGVSARRAAVVAGALGLVLAPWYAMDKAGEIVGYVAGFAASYGVLLGPILGAMLAHLASRGGLQGAHAIAAMALGIAVSYAFSLAAGQIVEVSLGGASLPAPSGLSWYVGVASSLAAGLLLARRGSPGNALD